MKRSCRSSQCFIWKCVSNRKFRHHYRGHMPSPPFQHLNWIFFEKKKSILRRSLCCDTGAQLSENIENLKSEVTNQNKAMFPERSESTCNIHEFSDRGVGMSWIQIPLGAFDFFLAFVLFNIDKHIRVNSLMISNYFWICRVTFGPISMSWWLVLQKQFQVRQAREQVSGSRCFLLANIWLTTLWLSL